MHGPTNTHTYKRTHVWNTDADIKLRTIALAQIYMHAHSYVFTYALTCKHTDTCPQWQDADNFRHTRRTCRRFQTAVMWLSLQCHQSGFLVMANGFVFFKAYCLWESGIMKYQPSDSVVNNWEDRLECSTLESEEFEYEYLFSVEIALTRIWTMWCPTSPLRDTQKLQPATRLVDTTVNNVTLW